VETTWRRNEHSSWVDQLGEDGTHSGRAREICFLRVTHHRHHIVLDEDLMCQLRIDLWQINIGGLGGIRDELIPDAVTFESFFLVYCCQCCYRRHPEQVRGCILGCRKGLVTIDAVVVSAGLGRCSMDSDGRGGMYISRVSKRNGKEWY
jgi:hypothetical protein